MSKKNAPIILDDFCLTTLRSAIFSALRDTDHYSDDELTVLSSIYAAFSGVDEAHVYKTKFSEKTETFPF